MSLSRALRWVETHARSISLQKIIGVAVRGLMSTTTPDWPMLVSLGHWAKHRDRPDLLTHVLVDSESGPKGVESGEALLAEPYVETGQARRLLFSSAPVIVAGYMERDPKNADAREWRAFLEKAGAKGALKVQCDERHANRWEGTHVAEFLGLEVDAVKESNNRGYKLLDFDIEPPLHGPDAREELRRTIAPWLEEGFNALKGKGRRRYSYFYFSRYNLRGNAPSSWAPKLSRLAWVPCNDGKLRCPQDVLPQSDLARGDSPVAELSSGLLHILEQEGVSFGAAIPEATSLRRLSAVGSQLEAEELAKLLCECRGQVLTDEDRHHLERVVQVLTVPPGDGSRVPCNRIVQRVGGRLRGTLGGLDCLDGSCRRSVASGAGTPRISVRISGHHHWLPGAGLSPGRVDTGQNVTRRAGE